MVTYAASEMTADITIHWLALSRCANGEHKFAYALTDCKGCLEEEDNNPPYPSISVDLVEGRIYDYVCEIVRNQRLSLQPSASHSSYMPSLNVDQLLSHFPKEHKLRSIAPAAMRRYLSGDDPFSHSVDKFCNGRHNIRGIGIPANPEHRIPGGLRGSRQGVYYRMCSG